MRTCREYMIQLQEKSSRVDLPKGNFSKAETKGVRHTPLPAVMICLKTHPHTTQEDRAKPWLCILKFRSICGPETHDCEDHGDAPSGASASDIVLRLWHSR